MATATSKPTNPLDDDATADRIGKNIAKLLMLRGVRWPTPEIRFQTSVGDKTPAGLARTLARVMAGEELLAPCSSSATE